MDDFIFKTLDPVVATVQYYNDNNIIPDNEFMAKYLAENTPKVSSTPITTSPPISDYDVKGLLSKTNFMAPKTTENQTVRTNSGEIIDLGKGETGNAKRAINYLMSKEGLTKEQATAIAANIQHESGFNTVVPGDTNLGKGNEAVGLAQWRLGRKNNMLNFLKQRGLPASSFEGQLSFLVHEMKTGSDKGAGQAWSAFQQSKDVAKLASDFDRLYERSDGRARKARMATAVKLYNT